MNMGGDSSVKENKESCVEIAKGKAVGVMDTPERSKNSQITSSVNTFEDSPVFNFLNNLSPIKPVKSIHISQTINSLSFSSLPSVFTSPHLSSLKESRFLKRHQLPDPSKPEFASEDANIVDKRKEIIRADNELDEHQADLDQPSSVGQVAGEASFECSKLVGEFEQNFKYDCSSPGSSLTPSCGLKTKHMAEYACTSTALIPFVQEASLRGLFGSEVELDGVSQIDQYKEATRCDWESLISDDPDQLIFESPSGAESYKNSVDPGKSLYSSISNDVQHTYSFCEGDSGEKAEEENETENLCTQREGNELKEISETHDTISGSSMSIPFKEVDNEPVSGLYRGMRRRCLVFEMMGSRRKRFDETSVSDSSAFLQSDGNSSTSNEKLLPTKAGNGSSQRMLPGIGLHLNALTTPKDYKFVKHEALGCGRLLIGPSPNANFQPPTTNQELLNNSLAVNTEREIGAVENGILAEDACQASGDMTNEEFNQSSPKKRRRRLEQAGDGEACKRCNCKKSKCLKLYCECFAAGVYCVEPCACIDCFNKPVHEDTVLATRKQIESRNPLAFAPKVIRSLDYLSETRQDESSKTPASARHKRGCNCKKSGCLKKYCECYQGGVGCSVNCRCEGCKNAFGRKDGTEAEFEEDETDTTEKGVQISAIQNDLEQNLDSVLPATPLKQARQTAQHPFSSKSKLPQPTFPSIGSSSGSYVNHGFRKPSFFQPPARFDKHLETVLEDEMPDFLQAPSPISCIKTSSPNSKRVSSPHSIGTSPSMRSSRKLILQSIPSFPSLTPKH